MDVDSEKAFEEMIQLLVAAGYFRARVSLYSQFDRIVGGMVWCIQNCSVAIKTELLFQRNLRIKQKISLSECIVKALVEMKCPHKLEPHQIHGLDLINIFPVVQWLVKNAMEFRDLTAQAMRNLALLHFDKNYSPDARRSLSGPFQRTVKRYYRQTETSSNKPIKVRLGRTLREFLDVDPFDDKTETQEGVKTQAEGTGEEGTDDLVEVMTATPSVSMVSQFVFQQSEAIRAVDEKFAAKHEELRSQGPGYRLRRAEHMRDEASQLGGRINQLISLRDSTQAEVKGTQRKIEKVRSKSQKTKLEVESLQRENEGVSSLLSAKNELEEVNRKIRDLKAECNDESSEMATRVDRLKEEGGKTSKERSLMEDKAGKLRISLGKKIRAVSSLERKIDQQLSAGEVNQYSRRFMELEEEMSISLRDTTQILLERNTKTQLVGSITSEIAVLESIMGIFKEGLKSAYSRSFFVEELMRISQEVGSMHQNAVGEVEGAVESWGESNRRFLRLLDDDRNYRLVLKKFSDECARNSKLNARISKV